MTRMKPSVQINNSISPIDNKVASADATEDSEDKEKEVGKERMEELGPESPEEREEDGRMHPESKGPECGHSSRIIRSKKAQGRKEADGSDKG